MLTADLARATVRSGVLRPKWVAPEDVRTRGEAARLVELYASHVDKTVGELDEAIADHVGSSADYLLQRGLAKLLLDRATVETRAPVAPGVIRECVFRLAGAQWPVDPTGDGPSGRTAIIANAAAELGISGEDVEAGLYADLRREEILTEVESPTAEELLHRYNMSLAQALLLRARQVRIDLPGIKATRARQLFRLIKFRRLMLEATPLTRDDGGPGWRLTLDGPLSIFRETSRYGLQLAMLLPGLTLVESWRLEAEVLWGKQKRPTKLILDHETGLVGAARDQGTWVSSEQVAFEKGFRKLGSDWKLSKGATLINLDGRDVLVPDYLAKHVDGRKAYVDIAWAWNRARFERRQELLAAAAPKNLVVLLAMRGNLGRSKKALDLKSEHRPLVVGFKGVIRPKLVLEALEEVS